MKKTNVSSPSSSWLLLAVLWGVLLLLAAWRPLALPDEGRYGEIGRWMLDAGLWRLAHAAPERHSVFSQAAAAPLA